MPLDVEVDFDPGNIVLHGDPAPLSRKRGRAPIFSAYVYRDQTAGWIKVPLGMEVGLGPGDFVFDGDPAPPEKRYSPHPIFGPCLVAKRLDGSRCHLVRR